MLLNTIHLLHGCFKGVLNFATDRYEDMFQFQDGIINKSDGACGFLSLCIVYKSIC